MKKLIFLLLFIPIICFSQNIRNVKFGDTKEQVKSIESSSLINDLDNVVIYKCDIIGLKYWLSYLFVDNKLNSVFYRLKQEYDNDNFYITDYYWIKDLLSKKYGYPVKDEEIWKDETAKGMKQYYGLAISSGAAIFKTRWVNDSIDVTLEIKGDDSKIITTIGYYPVYRPKEFYYSEDDKKAMNEL